MDDINSLELIKDFKQAVLDVWRRDGHNTWPIDLNTIAHLFMDLFWLDLSRDIRSLQQRGYSSPDIAGFMQNSARIIRLIMPCVLGMKALGLKVNAQREHIYDLLSLAGHLKHGDLLNRDRKNIVLSPLVFRRSVTERKMITAERHVALMLHKLCASLWNYAECLCFRTHGLIREFHGPYRFDKKGEEILIRDFICLKSALWDDCEDIGYDNIRVVAAYEGLAITIDIYNNVTIKEGSRYVDRLRAYYVEADGKLLDMEEMNRLLNRLVKAMITITKKIEHLDWYQLARKYADIFWFSKKEMRDTLNEDWRCPELVEDRIRNGQLNTKYQNIQPRELELMLKIAF